jgi:ribosome recycling factor
VIDETLLDAEEKMEKAVTVAKDDFGGIRTGRATPAMFNKIVVDYYGAMTPINQLSSLTVPEPRMAVISPYDKSSLGSSSAPSATPTSASTRPTTAASSASSSRS